MTRISRLILSAVVVLSAACAAQPTEKTDSNDPLQLSSATKERIAGSFTKDGVTIRFDTIRTGAIFAFEVRNGVGKPIIRGEVINDEFVTTVLGGELVLKYSTAEGGDQDIKAEGDQGALARMEALPELTTMAWLSHELGVRGYNGRDYPSALAMHMFNKSVAERKGLVLPNADQIGLSIEDQAEEEGYCSRPTANSCYGMCGPGCTCWSFVCGDCCYHGGCARHDNYCRGSGFWDGAKCWTTWGGAFFGC